MATTDVGPSGPCSNVPDAQVSPNESDEVLAPLGASIHLATKITRRLDHMIQLYPDAPAVLNAFSKTVDATRLTLMTLPHTLQGNSSVKQSVGGPDFAAHTIALKSTLDNVCDGLASVYRVQTPSTWRVWEKSIAVWNKQKLDEWDNILTRDMFHLMSTVHCRAYVKESTESSTGASRSQRFQREAAVKRVILNLNADYGLGIEIPDPTWSPLRRKLLGAVNWQYARWNTICRGVALLYNQHGDSLDRVLASFSAQADAASLRWVPKPRADPDTLPSTSTPPKAQTAGQQRDLESILVTILVNAIGIAPKGLSGEEEAIPKDDLRLSTEQELPYAVQHALGPRQLRPGGFQLSTERELNHFVTRHARSSRPQLRAPTPLDPLAEAEDSRQHIDSTFLENIGGTRRRLLDFWNTWGTLYHAIDVFMFSVKEGYSRVRWRCSCGTPLCADFDNSNTEALQELLKEMHHVPQVIETVYRNKKVFKTIYVNHAKTTDQLAVGIEERSPVALSGGRQEPARGTSSQTILSESLGTVALQQSHSTRDAEAHRLAPGIHLSTLTSIVHPTSQKKWFFEVCVNTGRDTVRLHEIDLDCVTSDGDLFQQIWDRYRSSRGNGIRRVFLKPRDVHFVLFSVSRAYDDLAGIHGKPSEYPPQEEVDKRHYHYRCPKILMPANLFLHFLRHPREDIRGGHLGDTWLQRLPKKLNASILDEVRHSTRNRSTNAPLAQGPEQDDILFGWGVHILEGPNHAGLSLVLTLGVAIAFLVSCLVVGLAKTQEAGFGVGQFLLAIVLGGMAAVYFALEDR